MKRFVPSVLAVSAMLAASVLAEDAKPAKAADASAPAGDSWTRKLKDRAERGKLQDHLQIVRGDSGKWNAESKLQFAPAIQRKPAALSLDDWADVLAKEKIKLSGAEETWLIFRTRQLDDSDRVWVEKIERRGNQFMVELNQAIWQGNYVKNFTYYTAFGVNLGKLPPGEYEAKWVVQPLVFRQAEAAADPKDRWPKDERPAQAKPTEFLTKFTVVAE